MKAYRPRLRVWPPSLACGSIQEMDIVYEDAKSRQVVVRNMHLAGWFDAPNVDQMHEWGRQALAVKQRNPKGTGLMNLIVSGTPAFSAEVRAAVKDYTERAVHDVGAAHIVLVRGLLASAVRGFLGTAMLLGRPKNPTKVFGELGPAATWMATNAQSLGAVRWDADALQAACQRAITR